MIEASKMTLRRWWHRFRKRPMVVRRGQVYGWLRLREHGHFAFSQDVRVFHTLNGSDGVRFGVVVEAVHPDLRWTADNATDYYDRVGASIAAVTAHEMRRGCWLEGHMLDPDWPDGDLLVSGDWRRVDGIDGLTLIAAVHVHEGPWDVGGLLVGP